MRTSVFHFIEDVLRDYPRTNSYIRDVQDNILAPYNPEHDENVGGGRKQNANNRGVEIQALTIDSDKAIRKLKEHHDIIEWTLEEADDATRTIITELYFKRTPTLTITGVAMSLNISRSAASRKRMYFFNQLVKRFGLRP